MSAVVGGGRRSPELSTFMERHAAALEALTKKKPALKDELQNASTVGAMITLLQNENASQMNKNPRKNPLETPEAQLLQKLYAFPGSAQAQVPGFGPNSSKA